MILEDIVTFWQAQYKNDQGQWLHPADEEVFEANPHSFNLDFPVSPYIGDILCAPVIIMGANAGYKTDTTPAEFPNEKTIDNYVKRVGAPSESDWSFVSKYYERVNYGKLIVTGQAALINACAYRSPKISAEPENRRLVRKLTPVTFTRHWLLEALFPFAKTGHRLVIVKRPGLWNLPDTAWQTKGVIFDPAPVSPQITSRPWAAVMRKLGAEQ